jgi:septum formation protein
VSKPQTTTFSYRTIGRGPCSRWCSSTSRYRRRCRRLGAPLSRSSPPTNHTRAPAATALRLAVAKARSVAPAHPHALIVGSDQVADCDGEPVGKPGTHERALAQLGRLSGRTVVFHTGLALLDAASGQCQSELIDVRSTFRALSAAEIDAYLRREQPYDCAGSVRSEALGIVLFGGSSDDPRLILPLIRLAAMLRSVGYPVLPVGTP